MYPEGMSFREEIADESLGILFGRLQAHVLYLHWVTMPAIDPKQIDQALKDAIDYVGQSIGLGKVTLGLRGESQVKEHSVAYTRFSAPFEGMDVGGAVASWYCDKTTRLFTLLSFNM
jgi:hypothetical protein